MGLIQGYLSRDLLISLIILLLLLIIVGIILLILSTVVIINGLHYLFLLVCLRDLKATKGIIRINCLF